MSPATSGLHLSKLKNQPKMPHPTALGRMSPERFKQEFQNFTLFLETVSLTNLPDMTLLAASGRLHDSIKYCKKVRKMGVAGKQSTNQLLCNIEAPNFTGTSTPT